MEKVKKHTRQTQGHSLGPRAPVRGRNGPVRERNRQVSGRNIPMRGRNSQVRERNGPVRERNTQVRERNSQVRERNSRVRGRDAPVRGRNVPMRGRNSPVRGRNGQVRERNGPVRERNTQVRERDSQVRERNSQVRGRDAPVRGRNVPMRGRNGPVRERNSQVRGRDVPVGGRNVLVRGRNSQVRGRNSQVRERNGPVRGRNSQVRGRNSQVRGRNVSVRGRDRPVRGVQTRLGAWDREGGVLHRLPKEVLDVILGKLSVLELSALSLASKGVAGFVLEHVSSERWRCRAMAETFHSGGVLERRASPGHCRALGLLLKRSTLLLPTKNRLKIIFHRLLQVPCFILERCSVQGCLGFESLGVIFQTLIAGWQDRECHKAFISLCELTNILPKMVTVVHSRPGARVRTEAEVRRLCRRVLLDTWSGRLQGQFWLIELLKPWPMVTQSRLLLLLYGPLLPDGAVGWLEPAERALPPDALWDLARALVLLFSEVEVRGWTADSVLVIVEELTETPRPWHEENVARLLVLCGGRLCYTFMASKVLNGRLVEVSELFVHITMVCERDGHGMKWAAGLLQKVCQLFRSNPEKIKFLENLESTFAERARRLFEIASEGNAADNTDVFQTLCVLFHANARFHAEVLHVCVTRNER